MAEISTDVRKLEGKLPLAELSFAPACLAEVLKPMRGAWFYLLVLKCGGSKDLRSFRFLDCFLGAS